MPYIPKSRLPRGARCRSLSSVPQGDPVLRMWRLRSAGMLRMPVAAAAGGCRCRCRVRNTYPHSIHLYLPGGRTARVRCGNSGIPGNLPVQAIVAKAASRPTNSDDGKGTKMKIKYHMSRGYTIECRTVPATYNVVGTTTGYGMRIRMPRHTGLGWQNVDWVELTLEPVDVPFFDGNLRDCVRITRGRGSKGKPRCNVEYKFDGYTMAVGVRPDEVRRVQAIREEWARFRQMMRGATPRGVRVGEMRKKAKNKMLCRDSMAIAAFIEFANVSSPDRMRIVDMMYDFI